VAEVDFGESLFMAYNSRKIFLEVDRLLTEKPNVRLHELARRLRRSHPTIEKAVFRHTSLTFREYQKKRLLEMGIDYLKQGYKPREIGSLLGYKWSENYLHLVKISTGHSLRELGQDDEAIQKSLKLRE
jgi:methylphosphotriester-DNA--protein-cysteine methyltransferase